MKNEPSLFKMSASQSMASLIVPSTDLLAGKSGKPCAAGIMNFASKLELVALRRKIPSNGNTTVIVEKKSTYVCPDQLFRAQCNRNRVIIRGE